MEDFVYVPIPRSLYDAAIQWLARRTPGSSAETRSSASPTPVQGEVSPSITIGGVVWTVETLERSIRESMNPLLVAVDLLVSRAAEWVSQSDICAATGQSPNQLRGTWGQLTKRARSRYGLNAWPFESKKLGGEWHFRMPQEVAVIVRRVREDMPPA